MKRNNDEFWAPSLLSELGLDELERKVVAEVMADVEDSEHPWCISGADFVKALMGIIESRTDKEVEAWLRDLRGEDDAK